MAATLYPPAIGIAAGSVVIRPMLMAIIVLFVIVLRWFGTQEEGRGRRCTGDRGLGGPAPLLRRLARGFEYLPGGGPEQTRQPLAFVAGRWGALVPFVLRRTRR